MCICIAKPVKPAPQVYFLPFQGMNHDNANAFIHLRQPMIPKVEIFVYVYQSAPFRIVCDPSIMASHQRLRMHVSPSFSCIAKSESFCYIRNFVEDNLGVPSNAESMSDS